MFCTAIFDKFVISVAQIMQSIYMFVYNNPIFYRFAIIYLRFAEVTKLSFLFLRIHVRFSRKLQQT
jgi:hypothetical protein